jgi:hypothetical protein
MVYDLVIRIPADPDDVVDPPWAVRRRMVAGRGGFGGIFGITNITQ